MKLTIEEKMKIYRVVDDRIDTYIQEKYPNHKYWTSDSDSVWVLMRNCDCADTHKCEYGDTHYIIFYYEIFEDIGR